MQPSPDYDSDSDSVASENLPLIKHAARKRKSEYSQKESNLLTFW